MRVHKVKKARKSPGRCIVCGEVIEAGSAYKWLQAYRGPKRSAHADCSFRSSHLSTGRIAEVYAAQESAQDELAEVAHGDADALHACLETFRDEVQRLADEYQEAADAIGEHFDGSEQHMDLEEKAGELEDWVSNIDDAISEVEDPDFDEDEDAEDEVVRLGPPNCPLHPGPSGCGCAPVPANAEQLAQIAAMAETEPKRFRVSTTHGEHYVLDYGAKVREGYREHTDNARLVNTYQDYQRAQDHADRLNAETAPKAKPESDADPRARWYDERYDQAENVIGECPL